MDVLVGCSRQRVEVLVVWEEVADAGAAHPEEPTMAELVGLLQDGDLERPPQGPTRTAIRSYEVPPRHEHVHWSVPPFDDAAAHTYGPLRAALEKEGRLIGSSDLLIASIALANGLVLVTHNTAEFSRAPGLVLED